jgi:hypothetical protein
MKGDRSRGFFAVPEEASARIIDSVFFAKPTGGRRSLACGIKPGQGHRAGDRQGPLLRLEEGRGYLHGPRVVVRAAYEFRGA